MTVEQYQNDPYAQYLKKVAKVESGGKANAKNPLSSATGLYQFTNDTWKGVVSKYNLGYSLDDRNDPQKSEKVMRLFVKDNDNIIKPVLGREVTDTDRYLTHFLGAGGASSFFKNLQKNGNAPTTSVFSNKVISANKSVMLNKDGSPKTLSEIYGWASKKMGTKVTEESVKNGLIDFDIPNKLTNFAYSPTSISYEDEKESEEVKQAKEAIVQEEKEQTFLEDLANNRLESELLAQEAPEQQIQMPESNILESYGQIDQFVETDIAQQGGTKKKVLKTADKVVEASFIGKMLDYIPGAETVYDIKNIISGLGEGDYKKIGANTIGALLPGISGKAFEAIAEDWLPETPEIEKAKIRFNSKTSPAQRQEYLKKYGHGYLNNPLFIKDVLSKSQEGGKYTENEIALLKEIAIKDNKGQYNHPGKITQINSPSITMKGLDKPLVGISLETGEQKVMMPNLDYYFADTKNVLEIPIKNNNNG
jgi:hypothetical protein